MRDKGHESDRIVVIEPDPVARSNASADGLTVVQDSVIEDIITVGEGLEIAEREIGGDEAGAHELPRHESMVLAIVRDGDVLSVADASPETAELRAGDRVVELRTRRH